MNFETYRLRITPLSPLHIGCGQSFDPTAYVIDDGFLCAFDSGDAAQVLTPSDRDKLLALVGGRLDANLIPQVQRFFFDRRDKLAALARLQVPVLAPLARLYESRVGQTAQREARGREVYNKLEIDRTAFDAVAARPVLCGSSLKGAMRTAVLDQVNQGHAAHEKKGLHEFQSRLLKYAREPRGFDLERDPFRLLHIADAACIVPDGPYSEIRFAVDRKKRPVVDKDGALRRSMAETGDVYQQLECIAAWQWRAFEGQLRVQRVDALPPQAASKLPDAALRPDARAVARACNRFYRQRLGSECALLVERGYLDSRWHEAVRRLIDALALDLDAGRVMLLRVGRHSGAESVTLEGVRRIRIMQGQGQPPKEQPEALTVWLAASEKDQQQGLVPFGWLLLEVDPEDTPPPERPALAEVCAAMGTPLAQMRSRFAARQDAAQQERERIAAAQRQAREAEAQRAAEAAERERKDAEDAKRRAEMSPALQEVEDFAAFMRKRQEEMRGGKTGVGQTDYQRAQALARKAMAGEWNADERRAAADAIEQWLPQVVNIDARDTRKKLGLATLRGGA